MCVKVYVCVNWSNDMIPSEHSLIHLGRYIQFATSSCRLHSTLLKGRQLTLYGIRLILSLPLTIRNVVLCPWKWMFTKTCISYLLDCITVTRPTLERRTTLGHLRSTKPNVTNHFANQSQTCELLKNFFLTLKKMKSGTISGWTNREIPNRLSRG